MNRTCASRLKSWLFAATLTAAALSVETVVAQSGPTVVNAGSSVTFNVPAIGTNYAWRLEGTLVGTNGIVGTNGPSFTYSPTWFDVGTHEVACYETLTNGTLTNTFWEVRVRISLPATTASYYVATNGSDANAGTFAAPFLTLERARNAIRTNGVPAGGVTVWLRGGLYVRTNSFLLTNLDSGTMTSPVIYAGYPGETPVLSEGTPIAASAFVPLAASQTNRVAPGINPTNILELDLASAGVTHHGPFPPYFGTWVTTNIFGTSGSGSSSSGGICDLFYNDQRQWLSRYPANNQTNYNLGTTYLLMDGVATTGPGSTNYLNNPGVYTNAAGTAVSVGCAFHYYPSNATEVVRWQSALTNGGAWVDGFWRVDWQENGLQIFGIDTTNMVIEITNTVAVQGGIGYKYAQPAGSYAERWWVMNLLEDITAPGIWAMDFNRQKIYFYPPGPITNNSVVIADNTAPVVQLSQTTNVVFQSVTIEDGLGVGILITNGVNNLVLGCTVQNMNNYAVDLEYGFTNGVLSSLLQNLGGGGVLLHGGNASVTPRIPARNFVVNNLITNSGINARVYATPIDVGGNGAGSTATNCVGMRVAHNFLTVMPHLAILHGVTWDSLIEYNNVGNFGQISSGIGGIYGYTYVASSGNNAFRYNFVHDSPWEDGISFDQEHVEAHIYCNVSCLRANDVCYNTGTVGSALTPAIDQYFEQYNNIGAFGLIGFAVIAPTNCLLEENAMAECPTPYTWTEEVFTATNINQITVTAAALQSGPNTSYTNDPGFINTNNNDFRLIPSSPIYTDMPLFTQIPFEMMGLYNDETWSNAIGYSPYVTTAAVSKLGPGSATLNGTLVYPQFDVNSYAFVYWGTNDGGNNPAAWKNVTALGLQGAGPLSTNLTGLAATPYYYRLFATNAYGQAWASSSASFTPYSAGHVPANITWRGDGVNNFWDTNTNNPVWANTGTNVAFWNGDSVTFNDSGSNNVPVVLNATNQPAALEVNASHNYTFAGAGNIAGVTGLQKDGSGTLTLLTTNTYLGPTVINNGTVQVGNGSISGSLGAGNITNNATLIFNQPDNNTITGTINGSGGVVKSGAGMLTLAANNFYSGGTTISNGTLAITADPNLGAAGGPLNFAGGTLAVTSAGIFTLANRPVQLAAGGGTLSLANTLTVSNIIAGPGALTLGGGGTLILTASNTYAGATTVNGGLLQIDNGSATGSTASGLFLNGGSLLYERPDNFTQSGFITGNSTNSAINNSATSGQLTLTFGGATSNTFNTVYNSANYPLILVGGTNYLPNFGTDLRNQAANQTLILTNAYWFTPRIGGNGGPYMLGTNVIANATLETSCARGVKGIWQIQSGGVLRLNSAHYTNSVNENRFDFGTLGMNPSETASITIAPGGLLDMWVVQYDGFELGQNQAGSVAAVIQNGGTALIGVNGGTGPTYTNSIRNLLFNTAGTNGLTEYALNGGLLEVAGTLSANAAAAGGTNLFLFNGGVLAVNTFVTTNLFVAPTNSLVNLGGTLSPGGPGVPGKTIIQGNYICSNATVLAVDIGGTNQANGFTNNANYYDSLSVSGQAVLNGSLAVSLLNGFVPSVTNSFAILTNAALSGAFTNVSNGRVPAANYAGGSFQVVTNATGMVLTNFQVLLAQFTPSTTAGPNPLTVIFTNTSVGSYTAAAWNFGDGTTSNTLAATLTHTYLLAGTNPVSLTVSGGAGTNTASTTIVVAPSSAGPPLINTVLLAGTNLVLTATNGAAGANCVILSTTNLFLPMSSWIALKTNQFNSSGQAGFTNPVNPALPAVYFRLSIN